LLLDGEHVDAQRCEYPSLIVVVFRLAGNECEVMSRTFIGVHKSAIALLLNGAHHSNRSQSPPLCLVVLCRPGNESEVLLLNFMCIYKSATALLLDGERVVARGCDYPSLGSVVFRSARNYPEVLSRTVIRVHKSAIALLLDGVQAAHLWAAEARQHPSLGVVILCGAR